MTPAFAPRTLVLFIGDVFFFVFSLWLSLLLRELDLPLQQVFLAHLFPFSFLFAVWVGVFFIAGLYESRSIILARRALSGTLLVTQCVNIVIAALFFFFVPLFGITPKVLLVIYLVVSFVWVLLWRVAFFPRLGLQSTERALMVGEGPEIEELVQALKAAQYAPARIVGVVIPNGTETAESIRTAITTHNPRFVIADFENPTVANAFPQLYNYLSGGIRFIDAMSLYEEVFGRVPLSMINDRWVARNVSRSAHLLYDPVKRLMDIIAALVIGVVSLVLYPIFIVLIKLQDGGPVFYSPVRVGQNNRPIVMRKFRSMTGADQGSEVLKSRLSVTPVGRVMRKTRIDEFPQLFNVLRGDLSLIGPRPESPALVEEYAREIPYYNVRHLVKPGISGWAQLYHDNHPHHGSDVEATREKLSYDLYYLKHRSILLDLVIALKTIKKILSQSGV